MHDEPATHIVLQRKWVNAEQAAEYVGISVRRFHTWRLHIGLPFSRLGETKNCQLIFSIDDIDQYLVSCRIQPTTLGDIQKQLEATL